MGTLPIIKGFRLRILPSENEHLRRFPVIVFVITLMIGIQVPMMSCSGGVNLARPYLFRDYEMLTAYNPQQHSSHGHLFQQQKSSSSFTESSEDGSSEEGEETQQYTAPLILDIDDPEVKARWMGLSEQSYEEEEDEEYYEDNDEQQPRSLSSTEFSSRSSQMQSSGENKPEKSSSSSSSSNGKKSGDKPAGEESRGIMDNFSFNPFSYWQGESEDDQGQVDELPQSDETPEYSYYPYAYDASPTDYYYDPSDQYQNDDQKKQAIMPHLVPMQYDPPKPKPKPKPVLKQKKPKPKPPTKPKAPKAKPKPKPHPPQMKPRPLKMKKKPQFTQQFHYQEFGKPDKLSIISEKLSKLNPFNYVQIQKPQIKITQIPGDDPPPPGMHHGPPPHMKRRKPKRPHPPKRKPKPKPQPTMMQSVMNKIKPKPRQPKPKQKRPKKPQGEEPNPEFVMIFGEPNFGGFNSDDDGHPDYRDGQDEEDDDDDDDDDEEEDEEEEGDEDDEEDLPQVTSITHGELPSGEMTNGEASFSDDDQEEALMSNDDGEADAEQSNQPVEDDEGDYEDGVIGRVTSSNAGTSSNTDSETGQEDTDQREKSIKLTRLFGWRKKKRKRRPHKPVPARKPPHWKEYRPAPLIPETVTDGVSDAILKVVKHVGFLPEYDKIEKYGGHNKIKGKFTKTRPITLHHGLMTEVLRRRR